MKASAIAPASQGLVNIHGFQKDSDNPRGGLLHCALEGLMTKATVEFHARRTECTVIIDGRPAAGNARERVVKFIRNLQRTFNLPSGFTLHSVNSFPADCGLGSSASAFAATALAATAAARLDLAEHRLAQIVREGSLTAGSSIVGGISISFPGRCEREGATVRKLDPEKLPLQVIAAVIRSDRASKSLHAEARLSPFYIPMQQLCEKTAEEVLELLQKGDWKAAGDLVELNVAFNYALITTGPSRLQMWAAATLAAMHVIKRLQSTGVPAFYAMNSGPSLFCYTEAGYTELIKRELAGIGVTVLPAVPSGGATLISSHLF